MSYCEIITFKDGKPDDSVEFPNSHGGSAFIWTSVYDWYLKNPSVPHDSWLMAGVMGDDDRRLWDLAKRQDLPIFERAVHAATFDRAMIRREHFGQYAGHLREFVRKYPIGQTRCHLLKWADFIEGCDAEAIGFYGMSVSDNLWYKWDEEADESTPYDLATGTEHFEVYDWLAECDAETTTAK